MRYELLARIRGGFTRALALSDVKERFYGHDTEIDDMAAHARMHARESLVVVLIAKNRRRCHLPLR